MKLYRVYKPGGELFLIGPIETLTAVFGLRATAVERLVRETGVGGNCMLHFNFRQPFGLTKALVVEQRPDTSDDRLPGDNEA